MQLHTHTHTHTHPLPVAILTATGNGETPDLSGISLCPTTPPPTKYDVTTSYPIPTTPEPVPCDYTKVTEQGHTPITSTEGMGSDSMAGVLVTGGGVTDSTLPSEDRERFTAIAAILGTLSAVLLLTLVGVVTGWVWSCHRNEGRSKQR